MEDVVITRYWMALVLAVMALYVIIGLVGMKVKARRKKGE
jgi:hypothetical protein